MSIQSSGFLPRWAGPGTVCEMRVFLAYEDATAGIQAMRVLDPVLTGGQMPLLAGYSIWKFEMLQVPEFRRVATMEAAKADLVAISACGRGVLPAGLEEWLGGWVAARDGRPAALVAILSDLPASLRGDSRVEAQLEEWAHRAGTDFFVQKPSRQILADEAEARMENAAHLGAALHGVVHWGLNE